MKDHRRKISTSTEISTKLHFDIKDEHKKSCLEKKAKCEVHKVAVCCFEQNLEAAPHKMATNLPYHKPSKKDEQDILDTAEEVRINSWETFFYGLLHMDTPMLVNLQKLTFISSVQILDAI